MIRSIYYLEFIIVHIIATITNNYVLVPTYTTRTENINLGANFKDMNDNMGGSETT